MIYRFIFTGYHNSEEIKSKNNPDVSHLSVFTYGEKAFMYFESENDRVCPDSVIDADMKLFPGGERWIRMPDVFHYSKPKSKEHWERGIAEKEPSMRLMYLKDDMVASYVFNHFRYQEEFPGDGNKYAIMGLLGNMLAFYSESPDEYDSEPAGAFKTTDTPFEDWGEVMDSHFRIEPDETEPFWKPMKRIAL